MDQTLVKDNMTKKKFVMTTLLFWLFFLLMALPQWMIMCLYSKESLHYTMVGFTFGIILVSCIHLFDVMKYRRPWNFVALFICYELLTVGMGLFLTKWNLIFTLVLISVAIIVSTFALLLSWILIAVRSYPSPGKLAVMAGMGFVLVFYIRSVDVFGRWFFLRDIEVTVFLFSVITVMVCHILMTNDTFDLLKRDDAMHVAFVLHLFYILLLVGGRVAGVCIASNLLYFERRNRTSGAELKLLNPSSFRDFPQDD